MMSEDMKMLFKDQQCEVSQSTSVYNCYDIYLDGPIEDPSYYRNAFQVLRNSQEGDLVRLLISSPGGNLNSAIIFKNSIEACRADVVAVIEAEAYSAAGLIALCAPTIEVKPYATLMCHSAAFSSGGIVQNVRDHVDFTSRHAEAVMEEVYKDFLTEEEMSNLRKGCELWFDYEQIGERLEKMFEARETQGCGDPSCLDCGGEELEGEIQQFSFEEMMDEVASKAAEQVMKKLQSKFDITPKAQKPKKPSTKTQKALDQAKEIRDTMENLEKKLEGQ
jgi:ATP-dependent protease ClpP protease subunit